MRGLRMEPCGTPHVKSPEFENASLMLTLNVLFVRYDLYQRIVLSEKRRYVILSKSMS